MSAAKRRQASISAAFRDGYCSRVSARESPAPPLDGADRTFDLRRELAGFAEDLNQRGLKRDLSDVSHFSAYARYGERLRLKLRIDSEMALKLLHKTEWAKNLGDLNSFLREFMLDPTRRGCR